MKIHLGAGTVSVVRNWGMSAIQGFLKYIKYINFSWYIMHCPLYCVCPLLRASVKWEFTVWWDYESLRVIRPSIRLIKWEGEINSHTHQQVLLLASRIIAFNRHHLIPSEYLLALYHPAGCWYYGAGYLLWISSFSMSGNHILFHWKFFNLWDYKPIRYHICSVYY